jgi:hypothetical protein
VHTRCGAAQRPTYPEVPVQITILNKRALSDPLPGVTRVYVGRPSPLGNPYAIGKDGDRAAVVAKYRRWLWANHSSSREVRLALHDLLASARKGPLELVCWCAPQACHADVIASCLRWLGDTYERERE